MKAACFGGSLINIAFCVGFHWDTRSFKHVASVSSSHSLSSVLYNKASLPSVGTFKDPSRNIEWDIHLIQKSEVKPAAKLIVNSFYKPKLVVKYDERSLLSQTLIGSIVVGFNSIHKLSECVSVYLGIRERLGKRLNTPNLEMDGTSFVLVATACDPVTGVEEVKGVAEVSLEIPNGRLPKDNMNTTFPFRFLVQMTELRSDEYQPYLSNVCVAPDQRQLGLGKLLCVLSEALVEEHWQKKSICLHVEKENSRAQKMYAQLGFQQQDLLSAEEVEDLKMQRVLFMVHDWQ